MQNTIRNIDKIGLTRFIFSGANSNIKQKQKTVELSLRKAA